MRIIKYKYSKEPLIEFPRFKRHESPERDRVSALQETADSSRHSAGQDDTQDRRRALAGRLYRVDSLN